MTFVIIFTVTLQFKFHTQAPKHTFFKLSLHLMFSILEDPKFTFIVYDLENENGSGFGFDICNFCLWDYYAFVGKPEHLLLFIGSNALPLNSTLSSMV